MKIKVETKQTVYHTVIVEADDHADAAHQVREMDASTLYNYETDNRLEIFDTEEV